MWHGPHFRDDPIVLDDTHVPVYRGTPSAPRRVNLPSFGKSWVSLSTGPDHFGRKSTGQQFPHRNTWVPSGICMFRWVCRWVDKFLIELYCYTHPISDAYDGIAENQSRGLGSDCSIMFYLVLAKSGDAPHSPKNRVLRISTYFLGGRMAGCLVPTHPALHSHLDAVGSLDQLQSQLTHDILVQLKAWTKRSD